MASQILKKVMGRKTNEAARVGKRKAAPLLPQSSGIPWALKWVGIDSGSAA